MAKKVNAITSTRQEIPKKRGNSPSLLVASKGISTSEDFAGLMSTLMADLLADRVSYQIGNAVCNAGGKLLKMVEMELKYGHQKSIPNGRKTLALTRF